MVSETRVCVKEGVRLSQIFTKNSFHILQNELIGLVRSKQAKTEPKMTKAYNRRLPLGKNDFY